MPVIGHHAPRENSHVDSPPRLVDDVEKRQIIAVIVKDRQPPVGTVENMVDDSALGGSPRSSHARMLPGPNRSVKIRFLTPFLSRESLWW